MAATLPKLADLSDTERLKIYSFLTECEHAWDEGKLAELAARLPAQGTPLRRLALIELVKIDIRQRWQRQLQATVESYLPIYPELNQAGKVPLELIQAEFDARQESGTPVTWSAMAERFPRETAELARIRSAAESAVSNDNTQERTAVFSAPSTPAVPSAAPPATLPGAEFGRYKIAKMLGQGGMGSVYLAHDTQLKRPVALKVPHFSAHNAPRVLARFQREAQAAATLTHPNICPVYDVGEIGGVHYLTMAFIEGKPLSAFIRADRPLPQREAAERVLKIALALEEAHAKGVVHRDLKPSNVMINQRDEPVIMDFGLAHLTAEGEARITQAGMPLGTPSYMAPEQVVGEAGAAGPSCDIYSLGVMLYELITGRVPFTGSVGHVMAKVLREEPPKPSSFRPDLDPRLEQICLKAMAKEAADRYPSMADLATEVADYLQAGPATVVAPVGKRGQRHKPDTSADFAANVPATLEWAPGGKPQQETESFEEPPGRGRAAADATAAEDVASARKSEWLKTAGVLVALVVLVSGLGIGFSMFRALDAEKRKLDAAQNDVPLNATGAVDLKVADASLSVHVDDKLLTLDTLGNSIELAVGWHRLRVTGKDIETIERSFEVRPGVRLALPIGPVYVGTIPYPVEADLEARVEVDGKPMPPGKLLRLSPGTHRLRITGPNIDTIEQTITIKRGDNPALDVKPIQYGTVQVVLAPADVAKTVELDMKPLALKNLAEPLRLPVGQHRLTVRGDDIDTIDQHITVRAGKNPSIHLEPVVFGTIKLDWKDPVAGSVFHLDGKVMNSKMLAGSMRLVAGKHRLKIGGPEIDTIEQDFTVRPGVNEPLTIKPVFYGTIKIELSDAKAEVDVRLDGQLLSSSKRGAEQRLAVGDHELRVSGPGFKPIAQTIAIKRGSNPPCRIQLERRDGFASGDKHVRNSLGMTLVRVPNGKFVMGSPRAEVGRLDDEIEHAVTITRPFYLGVHEVRVGEFGAFVKEAKYKTEAERTGGAWLFNAQRGELEQDPKLTWNTPGWKQEDDFPVVCVTYHDAQAFCEWLGRKESKTYRLPTEAEWEYACRGDTKGPFAFGDSLSADQANFNSKYGDGKDGPALGRAAKTGNYKANAFGLFDMHGNVWEWCDDFYKDYENGSVTPKAKGQRVLRGGGWIDRAARCRSAYRSYDEPARCYPYVGFRVVVDTADE